MNILEERRHGPNAHLFAVELEMADEPDAAVLRGLWESAPNRGAYGVPHAKVIYEGKLIGELSVSGALQVFGEWPEDERWRWSADGIAHFLLRELLGIKVTEIRLPPDRAICRHGNPYATDDGAVRWLSGVCAPCVNEGEARLL